MTVITELTAIVLDDEKSEEQRTNAWRCLRNLADNGTINEREIAEDALLTIQENPNSGAFQNLGRITYNSRGLRSQTYGCGGGSRTLAIRGAD